MISAGGSYIARTICGWEKFRELLPLLTSRVLSLGTKGRVFDACARSMFFMVVKIGQLRPMT